MLKTRGGQLAAVPRLRGLVHEIDVAALEPQDRAELNRLIAVVRQEAVPVETLRNSAPEAESHTVTIEGGPHGQPQTIRQTEDSMTDAFRALVSWIRDHSGAL
jgi:hypothetical protein